MFPPGETSTLKSTWRWIREPFPFFEDLRKRHGDTFSMRVAGLPPVVVFSDPETVKQIFADDGGTLEAGKFNLTLRAFLGERSVLMLDGAEHMRHRKLLLPPFHGERMQAYGQVMMDETDRHIDEWPASGVFALHPSMQSITLEVILRTVFGMDDAARMAPVERNIGELLDIVAWAPLLLPFMQVDWARGARGGAFCARAPSSSARCASSSKSAGGSAPRGAPTCSRCSSTRATRRASPWSDDELRDELVTLLVAGHETTATALAWAARWILQRPEVEARLRAELEGAGGVDAPPERVAKLDYLDAVVRESLRLQPVIPIVGRVLAKDHRVGGYELPKGTGVVASIYLAHRREQAFPAPESFDPERFLRRKPAPYEWYPFGGGNRRCIGMAFALYEMKMVLARIFTRTRPRLDPRAEIRVVRRAITLTPSGGVRVSLDGRLS
jgi:cytochrome P450